MMMMMMMMVMMMKCFPKYFFRIILAEASLDWLASVPLIQGIKKIVLLALKLVVNLSLHLRQFSSSSMILEEYNHWVSDLLGRTKLTRPYVMILKVGNCSWWNRQSFSKLDGVAAVTTDPPRTIFTTLSEEEKSSTRKEYKQMEILVSNIGCMDEFYQQLYRTPVNRLTS